MESEAAKNVRIAENVRRYRAAEKKQLTIGAIYFASFVGLMLFFFQLETSWGILGCVLTPVIYIAIAIFFLNFAKLSAAPDYSPIDSLGDMATQNGFPQHDLRVQSQLVEKKNNWLAWLMCGALAGSIYLVPYLWPNLSGDNGALLVNGIVVIAWIIIFLLYKYVIKNTLVLTPQIKTAPVGNRNGYSGDEGNQIKINLDIEGYLEDLQQRSKPRPIPGFIGALITLALLYGFLDLYGASDIYDVGNVGGLVIYLIFPAISGFFTWSYFFPDSKNLEKEMRLVRNSGNTGMIMSPGKISISLSVLENPVKRHLLKNGKATADLSWGDIHGIRVDNDSGEDPAYYTLKIGKSSLTADIPFSAVNVSRAGFYGQEREVISAFQKFARCPITINDRIR